MQHVTFLVEKEVLTPESMVGYVITRHTVMMRDQPPLACELSLLLVKDDSLTSYSNVHVFCPKCNSLKY